MSILVCFALKEEAAPFHKIAAGSPGVFTIITGIGRRNAEKSVRRFLAGGASVPVSRFLDDPARPGSSPAPPEMVLTCGFAGGLRPDLKIGDVVFDLAGPAANDQTLIEALLHAGASPAKFFCSDRVATTVSEKKSLQAGTGADAVEMESAAIHAVCRERGLPCATVRVISDTAGEDLPLDFNALSRPDQSLDFGKLAWAIAKSPGKIPELMALRKKTRFAAERLAAVLGKIVRPDSGAPRG